MPVHTTISLYHVWDFGFVVLGIEPRRGKYSPFRMDNSHSLNHSCTHSFCLNLINTGLSFWPCLSLLRKSQGCCLWCSEVLKGSGPSWLQLDDWTRRVFLQSPSYSLYLQARKLEKMGDVYFFTNFWSVWLPSANWSQAPNRFHNVGHIITTVWTIVSACLKCDFLELTNSWRLLF